MLLKNSVCNEVSIQEELVYESAEGFERALLLLKVVLVTHHPSLVGKDLVNEISR